MEYLAINRPIRPLKGPSLSTVLEAHGRWIDTGFRSTVIVRAGRWGSGGMYILEARNEQEATAIVKSDPLVASGLVEVEMDAIKPPPANTAHSQ